MCAAWHGADVTDVSFSFAGAAFRPLPCGALYWPAERTLLVADLHLEKASFFALHGQLLPPYDSAATLARLIEAVAATGAVRVVALGDSFHDRGGPARLPDRAASALAALARDLDLVWVAGNHDGGSAAQAAGRTVAELTIAGIALRHEADPEDPGPAISGHWHPRVGVTVRGRRIGRRCFALTAAKLVLPAYGALTGGLDVRDPAIAAALGGPLTALVPTPGRLLRFPVAA